MKPHIIWATALVLSITAISYWACQYNIEADKQTAFLAKACIDAGGSWSITWNQHPNCQRPK